MHNSLGAQLRDNIPGIASQGMLSTFASGVDIGESQQQWRKKLASQPMITKGSLSQLLLTKRLKIIGKYYKKPPFSGKT
ncbi:hypothetical protein [Microcoleus sp. D2_18a_B4]|uniref:hypothetical protein n=1 Tax=Microcoleus sp. D2_18a_B4 TaxID=3055329 RepID=UPI002FD52865